MADPDGGEFAASPKGRADSRTRDELANERTFLAWLRTAANVMIVGLGVAKFGSGSEVTVWSLASGSILILIGAIGAVYGSIRYRMTSNDLASGLIWPGNRTRGPVIAAVVLVVAMVISLTLLLMEG